MYSSNVSTQEKSESLLALNSRKASAAPQRKFAAGWLALWIFCVIGVLALLVLAIYPLFTVPAEDAVILFQYSRNLAETGVISYIPGGPRAEGATDFLWMAYIAGALRLHIQPAVSTAVANVVCCVALAWILLRLARRQVSFVALFAVIGAAACLPPMLAALEGFSVLPFTFAIALLVFCLTERREKAAAGSALLLCLLRPDGIIFAVPLLLRQLWLYPSVRTFLVHLLLFVVPGTAYFLWRWHYFQHFLPLPFLVKSDTHRILGLFDAGSVHILPYVVLALVIIGAGLQRRLFARTEGSLFVAIIVIPTLFYCSMRLDQNIDDRFYAYLPLAAGLLLALDWQRLAMLPAKLGIVAGIAALVLTSMQTAKGLKALLREPAERQREVALARAIGSPDLRGTMLISESGILPYYSRWHAADTWGLNTAEYATHLIQPSDVLVLDPDTILLHSINMKGDCRPTAKPAIKDRSWNAMIDNVQSGIAISGHYQTWRVPFWSPSAQSGFMPLHVSPSESFCWYVSDHYSGRVGFETALRNFGGSPVR